MLDFAVIINNEIKFCSRDSEYQKFEIAIFSNILINQIAEKRDWSLHKLIMHPANQYEKLNLLIHRQFIENTEILICLLGELKFGSAYGYQLLENFCQQISTEYSNSNLNNISNHDAEGFKKICDLFYTTLSMTESMFDNSTQNENYNGNNQLIYIGLSTNGLPISSKLYEDQSILQFENEDKKELITTVLSGQLATISINSIIRAQCFIDSIQIKIESKGNKFVFFNFSQIGENQQYTMETLSTGNPNEIEDFLQNLKKDIDERKLLNQSFSGKLKNYLPLNDFFQEIKIRN
jgi:hypothetical protein